MFRSMSGFKAQYHYLTMLVVSEFNEWRVLIFSPDLCIQGTRQFSAVQAKEHAIAVARAYVHERKQQSLPDVAEVAWEPTAPDDWLVWC